MAIMSPSPSATGRVLVGASIVLLALNLRVAVSSVGVVLDSLQSELGFSATAAGVLTTLPMLCFAAFGLATDALVRRVGLHRTTVLALVALAAGISLRVLADGPWLFFAMSFLALSGAAIGNVVLPPLAKVHFPDRIALLSALFGAALMGGATLGSVFSVPAAHTSGGWRLALGMWAVLTVVTLLPWLTMIRHDVKRSLAASDHPLPLGTVARSPLTWAMLVCFAAQSGGAYAQFGWFAAMLTDGGVAADTSGIMLGVITGVGIPMTLALPWLIRRWGETPALPVVFSALTVAGWLGVLLAPDAVPLLWAVTLGLGGGAFSWVLAMIGYRTTTAAGTTALSAMTQGPGYLAGAIVPFGIGLLHDLTGDWNLSLYVLIGTSVMIGVSGFFVTRSAPLESRLHH